MTRCTRDLKELKWLNSKLFLFLEKKKKGGTQVHGCLDSVKRRNLIANILRPSTKSRAPKQHLWKGELAFSKDIDTWHYSFREPSRKDFLLSPSPLSPSMTPYLRWSLLTFCFPISSGLNCLIDTYFNLFIQVGGSKVCQSEI
jgi:hypothetical protein